MLFLNIFVSFVAFPESQDAILSNENKANINVESSGSLGLFYGGSCHKTYGNETLLSDEYKEWCSNIAKDKNDPAYNPWIQYSLKGKRMQVSRYSVRNGCCRYACCCTDDNGKIIDEACCCYLYSYSLQASNDNKTWKVLHKVEKDKNFYFCLTKTFELPKQTESYTYFRFVLDEEWPSCAKCMQINQIELYGHTTSGGFVESDSSEDEESISIIGRVRKNE